jgi:uncharacterized protein YdiU (UPF0061 family)
LARDGLPGAVLTRVAASHVRIGTFQFFAARRDLEALRHLADYVIARHYPQAAQAANPYRALLDQIVARQAELIAQWLLIGFIHGVMNTDNMSVAGETIDYGPCAFMDNLSSIDGLQLDRPRWTLCVRQSTANRSVESARIRETLLPLLADDEDTAVKQAQEGIDGFIPRFQDGYANGLPESWDSVKATLTISHSRRSFWK